MEFGLIPKLDQYNFNSQQKIQTVNASNETSALKDSKELLEVPKQEDLVKEAREVQKADLNPDINYVEFVLSNLNFGFNDASQDFYVKVQRAEKEFQYPTEDMMRLKAYLMGVRADQSA